jgi:hypothetical protein
MPSRLAFVVAAVIGSGLIAGCNHGGAALRYNQSLVDATNRMQKVGEAFGMAVAAALQSGDDGDVARAEQAYEEMKNTLNAVREETERLSLPSGQGAKELSEAFSTLLQQNEDALNKELKEVLDVLKNKKLAADEKQAEITEILKRVAAKGQMNQFHLQRAQQRFAEEHKIILKK